MTAPRTPAARMILLALSLTSKHTPTAWMISASIPNPVPGSGHFKRALPGHFWQALKVECFDSGVKAMGQDNISHRFPAKQRERPKILVIAVQRLPSQLCRKVLSSVVRLAASSESGLIDHAVCSIASSAASTGISPEISLGRRRSRVVRSTSFRRLQFSANSSHARITGPILARRSAFGTRM